MEKDQTKKQALLRLKQALAHKIAWKRQLEEEFAKKGQKVIVEML